MYICILVRPALSLELQYKAKDAEADELFAKITKFNQQPIADHGRVDTLQQPDEEKGKRLSKRKMARACFCYGLMKE